MVRKIVIFVGICGFFASCATFSIQPCVSDSSYRIIDTASFYFLIKLSDKKTLNEVNDNYPKYPNGIKFYAEGKVGFIYSVTNINDVSKLHPKRAAKGVYCIQNANNGIIEFKFRHVQSGTYIHKEIIHSIKGDTIVTYTPKRKNSPGEGYYSLYIKKKLPKEVLIYTPNW